MEYVVVGSALLGCVGIIWGLFWRKALERAQEDQRELCHRLESTLHEAAESRGLAYSLAATLDFVSLGVVIEDGDGRVVFRNQAALAMMGTTVGDSLTSHALARLLRSARDGEAGSEVLELYGPPRRLLSVSTYPLAEGSPDHRGAAAVMEDTSERHRLEAVRRDFVANVSHELKTPVGALGLLAETMGGENDAEVLRHLADRVQTEAFRVARIIQDLISLSRLEAEEAPRHEPVSLHLVVEEAVEQVKPAAGLHGVGIHVFEAPSEWTVLGDRRQLVSALFHLLENAVKYSDKGSRVEVALSTDDDRAEVAVRDYGVGIPSRDLERVFERFYRVDRGRSRDTGGTGLGLAIVRHVASNHGGQVLVKSVEGEGSLFTLSLPLAGRLPRPSGQREGPTGEPQPTVAVEGRR